jgi:hypothetical protein
VPLVPAQPPTHLQAALVPPLALEARIVQLIAQRLHGGQAGGGQAAGASQAAVLRHLSQLAGQARVQACIRASTCKRRSDLVVIQLSGPVAVCQPPAQQLLWFCSGPRWLHPTSQ